MTLTILFMTEYEKKARLYPTLLSAAVPGILVLWCVWTIVPQYFTAIPFIYRVLSMIGCAGIFIAACSFFGREVCRRMSKCLFQSWLFKEDETEMPTTDLLIYEKSIFSTQQIDNIRNKICTDFTISIPPKDQQVESVELRKTITDAVRQIREKTRANAILLDYNIRYGFCRNLLGGLSIGILFTFALIVTVFFNIIPLSIAPVIWALILQLTLLGGAFFQLKGIAKEYAKQLYNVYSLVSLKIC